MKYPSQHQEESQQQLHSPMFPVHLQESTGHGNLSVRGIRKTEETDSPAGDWLGLRNLQSDRHKWTFHIELMTRVTSHNTYQTHIYLFHSSDSKATTTPKKTRWRRIGEFGWDGDGMLGKGRRRRVDVVQILWLFVTQIGFPNSKSFHFIKWMLQWLLPPHRGNSWLLLAVRVSI